MTKIKKTTICAAIISAALLTTGCLGYYFYFCAAPLPDLSASPPDRVKLKKQPQYIEGEFSWRINKHLNRETLVRYLVPLDPATGKPGKNAANIVFYAPYNGDARRIRKGLVPWHRDFAEKMGYTIFSLVIEANTQITDEVEKYYIYRESGWHDLVFQVKKCLEKEYGLASKPLLIVGESSGGSMAQQMAAASPEKVAAAAWNGGTRYVPFGRHIDVALLALNTWGCGGVTVTGAMTEDARKNRINILNAETFPKMKKNGEYEHHAASEFTYQLIQSYIQGIVELRDANRGTVPPASQWPVKQGDAYYPSKIFAGLWNELPHSALDALNHQADDLIVFSPPDKPKSIVLMISGRNGILRLKDSLFHLYRNQALGMAILTKNDPAADLRRIGSALDDIREKPEWKNLPVMIFGQNFEGQLAITAGQEFSDKKIAGVMALNPELADHAWVKNLKTPVEILYSDELFNPPPAGANLTVKRTAPVKSDKDWLGPPGKNGGTVNYSRR